MKDIFTPAFFQPSTPAPWSPGGYMETAFTPAFMDDAGYGYLPGSKSMKDIFTPSFMDVGGSRGFLPGGPPSKKQVEKRTPSEKQIKKRSKSMKDTFTPALMERGDGFLPGKVLKRPWDVPNWLDPRLKGTPAYYPHALISYYHWRKFKHRPMPEDGYIIGDSGGFSVMTLGADIDARDALRWQMRETKVGVILDVPPVKKVGKSFVRLFDEPLAVTCRNVKNALPAYVARDKTAFRWWGAVHGWNVNDLRHWWEAVRKVYPFEGEGEGWCFKPRPNINPRTAARVLSFIKEEPSITRAHFLMTTGIDTIAVLLALGAEAGLEFISYDSTTFTLNAINRLLQVETADGLSWHKQNQERGKERHLRDYMLNTCQCPSCELLRQDTQRYSDLLSKNVDWGGYWVFRFAYHNLLCTLRVFENLRRAIAADPEKVLTEILGRQESAEVRRAFEGREVFDEGVGTPRTLLDLI